jgi:hypothetical protein
MAQFFTAFGESWRSRRMGAGHQLLLWLVCLLPLLFAVLDSWEFPWFGNPDQDLVFLRDGLRLWEGLYPGYGDHPGLVQMIVVRWSVDILSPWLFLDHSPTASVWAGFTDRDWQLVFVVAKLLNVFLMSFLLFACSLLWVRWLGRGGAITWALLCSMSLAAIVEVYQLRNEFYSSFFAFVALLLALGVLAHSREEIKAIWRSSLIRVLPWVVCSWLCFGFILLSMLAKVQVLPVLLIFLLVFPLVAVGKLGIGWFKRFYCLLLLLELCLLTLVMGYSSGLQVSWLQAATVLLAMLSPAAVVMTCIATRRGIALAQRLFLLLFSAAGVVCLAGYGFGYAAKVGWIQLVLNPLSARSYAVASSDCQTSTAICILGAGFKGIIYLFERSIDGMMLARILLVVVLVVLMLMALVEIYCLNCLEGNEVRDDARALVVSVACALILLAFGMAFMAGQRWAVDHYLPYQQPFLFAGLLLLAQSSAWGGGFWVGCVLVIALSVLLMYLRYPGSSRLTYVKHSLPFQSTGAKDGSLCAAQHAGPEWRNSSLWGICKGFAID